MGSRTVMVNIATGASLTELLAYLSRAVTGLAARNSVQLRREASADPLLPDGVALTRVTSSREGSDRGTVATAARHRKARVV